MPPEVPCAASDPPLQFQAVVPNNGADLPAPAAPLPATSPCRGLLLSAAGNVKVTDGSGQVNILPLQAGYNPGFVKRVWATGTDAVTIFAMY